MPTALSLQSEERNYALSGRDPGMPDRVVILNDASAVRGGATGVAMMSVALLQGRGVPVTLIVGDDAQSSDAVISPTDLIAICSSHILEASPLSAMVDGLYNRKAERILAQWIEENDTPQTVYHLHGWSKILSPAVFRALKPVASRLVVSAHDFFLVCPNGGYFDFRSGHACMRRPMGASCLLTHCDRRNYGHKLWRSARQLVRRALCDLGNHEVTVLAVHEGMLPHLEYGGVSRRNLRTLRNPVTPWSRTRIQAERNRIFLFVGRLDADKGIDLFLDAATDAGVSVRVAGRGPMAERLAAAYPHVDYVGWMQPDELPRLAADVRAVVVPSRTRETFSLVALEALTSGIPVAISRNAMIAQEVSSLGIGVSYEPQNQAELAGILQRFAADDALIDSTSRKAHAEAPQLAFTPDTWVDALLGIYSELLPSIGRRVGRVRVHGADSSQR